MAIFALQSLAGGFLDEDLKHFNKVFDDWCVQFEDFEDARLVLESLELKDQIKIVEITPLSYPKYFFPNYRVSSTPHGNTTARSSASSSRRWAQASASPSAIPRPRRSNCWAPAIRAPPASKEHLPTSLLICEICYQFSVVFSLMDTAAK